LARVAPRLANGLYPGRRALPQGRDVGRRVPAPDPRRGAGAGAEILVPSPCLLSHQSSPLRPQGAAGGRCRTADRRARRAHRVAREPPQPQARALDRPGLRPQRAPAARHAGRPPPRPRRRAPRPRRRRPEVHRAMIASPVHVTGGAGFIGSHLVEALLARGATVRVLDSLEPQVHGVGATRARHLPAGVGLVHASVGDAGAVDRALAGVGSVVHLAGQVGVGQSMYAIVPYVDDNVRGTAVLLDRLANGGHQVRRLVVASSMSIYGEGRYRCPACGPVAPAPRPLAQLQARDWELHCPTCGTITTPAPCDEDKPIAPTSVYAVTKRDQEDLCLCVGRAYGIGTVAL